MTFQLPIFNDGRDSVFMNGAGQRTFIKGCNSCFNYCGGYQSQYSPSCGSDRIYAAKPDFYFAERCNYQKK